MKKWTWPLLALFACAQQGAAQFAIQIQAPEMRIYATQLIQGDDELWGLGVWETRWVAEARGDSLWLRGEIFFREMANDHSVFYGKAELGLPVGELAAYPFCAIEPLTMSGGVKGNNAGAVGYKRYRGNGLAASALIRTDTFGPDLGKVGGVVRFRPIALRLSCSVAMD
ncbi:MAG: hypothetical protein ACK4NS_07510 [Saprospiraceae bacterium]